VTTSVAVTASAAQLIARGRSEPTRAASFAAYRAAAPASAPAAAPARMAPVAAIAPPAPAALAPSLARWPAPPPPIGSRRLARVEAEPEKGVERDDRAAPAVPDLDALADYVLGRLRDELRDGRERLGFLFDDLR
jgi:hypothetical protein